MAIRVSRRLVFSLLYLAVLFAGGAWVYARITAFSGQLVVAAGRSEHLVVRPSTETASAFAAYRNLPAELLPFDQKDAARRLGAANLFDAVPLPFRLRLIDVQAAAPPGERSWIELTGPDGTETVPVTGDGPVQIGTSGLTFTGIRRWTGILRHTGGRPMAVCALRQPGDPWTENIFVDAAEWVFGEPDFAIGLRWFRSEASAREHLPVRLGGLETARWGVLDGESRQWIRAFSPGSGMRLADGTEVTLLAVEEGEAAAPALTIEFKGGTASGVVRVNANESGVDRRVIFEHPAAQAHVLLLHGWRDGSALAAAYSNRERASVHLVEAPGVWSPGEPFPFDIRIDQCMAAALPVEAAGDPVWEALVESPEATLRLREGETVTWNDRRLRFRRQTVPPPVNYTFEVVSEGRAVRKFTLGPSDRVRQGNWRFRQSPGNPAALECAVLAAETTVLNPVRLAGAAIFMAAAAILVIARFGRSPEAVGKLE